MITQRIGTHRPATAISAGGGRLTWLDALRGFAAMVVVFWHLGPRAIVNAQDAREWIDLGKYGVCCSS